jgi:hypothetical protein
VMLAYAPVFVGTGVPLSCPVVVLKVAHDGRLAMANVNLLPSASVAAGWNE